MRARSPQRRRRFGERGAVIVEAALIMPIVIMISLGVVDLGFLIDHNLTLASATTAGTRAGVRAGNAPDADAQVLEAIASADAKLKPNSIEQIIVFRADDADGTVPPICFTGSDASAACNTYGPAALTTFVPETAWPPADRRVGAFGEADYLGVFVRTTHDYTIGIFGDSRPVTDTVVMQIDPTSVDGASAVIPPPPPTTTTTTTTSTTTTSTTSTTTTTLPPPPTTSTTSTTTTTICCPLPTTTTTTTTTTTLPPPPTTSTSTTSTTWPTPPTTGTNS